MPYVQYGGLCSCSIALEPGCSKFRGERTSWSSSVEPVRVQPFSTWGAFPFIVQGGAPIYRYLALCLDTAGVQFVLVSRRGPLGRSGVGRFDPGDLLGQGMILAISLGGAFPRCCPILAQSGWRDHSDSRSGFSSSLVRRNPCSLPAGLSYVALSPDDAPGEGCLTEACPVASGHTRWHNEMVHRGNHHYIEGRQRLRTPPPVVSRGPRERRCPFVRESCWLSPCRKIRMAGVSGLAWSLSWPTRLSGGAAPLERTSRVTGMALTRGARSGGRHVSREVGLLGALA